MPFVNYENGLGTTSSLPADVRLLTRAVRQRNRDHLLKTRACVRSIRNVVTYATGAFVRLRERRRKPGR
jgi:hypothetical protein